MFLEGASPLKAISCGHRHTFVQNLDMLKKFPVVMFQSWIPPPPLYPECLNLEPLNFSVLCNSQIRHYFPPECPLITSKISGKSIWVHQDFIMLHEIFPFLAEDPAFVLLCQWCYDLISCNSHLAVWV